MITVDVVNLRRVESALQRLASATGDRREVEKALLAGALVLEGEAKLNVQIMNAIDTGFMLNSIYSATKGTSGYKDARGDAESRSDATMLPEVKPDEMTAIVAVGAEYAPHVEYGTYRTVARPFLRQAVQNRRDDAIDAIADAVTRRIGWGQ